MPAPKGNKNAVGNKGGGKTPRACLVFVDRTGQPDSADLKIMRQIEMLEKASSDELAAWLTKSAKGSLCLF